MTLSSRDLTFLLAKFRSIFFVLLKVLEQVLFSRRIADLFSCVGLIFKRRCFIQTTIESFMLPFNFYR